MTELLDNSFSSRHMRLR